LLKNGRGILLLMFALQRLMCKKLFPKPCRCSQEVELISDFGNGNHMISPKWKFLYYPVTRGCFNWVGGTIDCRQTTVKIWAAKPVASYRSLRVWQ
jgi:hypothetical protein